MLKFTQILKSSIFLKIIMGLSGLGLISFTIGHLLGNFTLLVPEKGKFTGETFMDYSKSMEQVPLIKLVGTLVLGEGEFTGEAFLSYAKTLHKVPMFRLIEVFLFIFFIIHISTGLSIIIKNYRARPVRYKSQKGKGKSTLSSRTMPYTGILILVFLIFHLNHFSFSGKNMGHEMFLQVKAVFNNPVYIVYYVLLVFLLGFHINHGFQSAFQTFGWHHNKYNPIIRISGKILAVFISFGFATIPLVVHFFFEGAAK